MRGRVTQLACALALLCLLPAPAGAARDSGYVAANSGADIADGDVRLSTSAVFVVRWSFSVMMGDPVVGCSTAWFLPKRVFARSHPKDPIPPEVLAKIRVVKATFVGETLGGGERVLIECDLGLPRAPVVGAFHFQSFPGLIGMVRTWSKQQRSKAMSFNVKDSPNWARLFFRLDGAFRRQHVSAARAKALVKKKMSLRAGPILSTIRPITAEFDLSAVREWLGKKKKKELATKRAKLDQMNRALAKRKVALDGAPAADFWRAAENPETTPERRTRRTLQDDIKRLDRQADKLSRDAARGRANADAALQAWKQRRLRKSGGAAGSQAAGPPEHVSRTRLATGISARLRNRTLPERTRSVLCLRRGNQSLGRCGCGWDVDTNLRVSVQAASVGPCKVRIEIRSTGTTGWRCLRHSGPLRRTRNWTRVARVVADFRAAVQQVEPTRSGFMLRFHKRIVEQTNPWGVGVQKVNWLEVTGASATQAKQLVTDARALLASCRGRK